jgi:hypothetical protein
MKFCRVTFIVLFSFICISLNAQVFVGGGFGFNGSNSITDNGTTTTLEKSDYNFSFLPYAGKFLSEKVAAGVGLEIILSGTRTNSMIETKHRASTVGISPFVRYYAIKWDKFSVYGEGNIGFSFSDSRVETEGSTTDGPKSTSLYLNVYPGLSYDINEKLSLQTSLNVLGLGYSHITTKDGSSKDVSSGFNIGAGLDDIISVGTLTIGGIYKF